MHPTTPAVLPVCDAATSKSGVHFNRLLARFDDDRERAGEQYELLRRKLVRFFECRQCQPAEDLADKTIDRVARRCDEEPVRCVHAFAMGVAKNITREFRKWQARSAARIRHGRGAVLLDTTTTVEDVLVERSVGKRRVRSLRKSIRALSPDDRELLIACLGQEAAGVDRRHVAARFGLTDGALRTRMCRLRARISRAASGAR